MYKVHCTEYIINYKEEEVGSRMTSGDWEWLDVCIRCYLLGEVVQEVIDELEF